jgi:polysaccharide export outer membrane protein
MVTEFKGRSDEALLLSEAYIEAATGSLEVAPVENKSYTTISGFPEYRIGPEDVLVISIWEGRNQKEYETTVQVDGTISFAYTVNLEVGGLSPTQVRNKLLEQSREFYRRPNVNISVKHHRAWKASVLGEIRDLLRGDSGPGEYPLKGKTHVVEFISRHGGPTSKADLAQVKVVRAQGHTFYLNLYKAMFEGDAKENIILDDGDIIFLPSLEVSPRKFYVLGEVGKPGVYELKDEVNVLEALMIAESYTDRAAIASIAVIRGELTNPEIILVNLEKLIHEGDKSENIEIRDGDIIFVSRHFLGNMNYVLRQVLPSLNTLFLIDRLK